MPAVTVAAVALGSNLGDRRAHLAFACQRLGSCLSGLLVMLFVWGEGTGYVWIALGFMLVGGGVGLALTGDVMLGRLVDQYVIQNRSVRPEALWGDVLPVPADA